MSATLGRKARYGAVQGVLRPLATAIVLALLAANARHAAGNGGVSGANITGGGVDSAPCPMGQYLAGADCIDVSAPCYGTYEDAPPTAITDRVCGVCHPSCLSGFDLGCSGPAAEDCGMGILSGGGGHDASLWWVARDGSARRRAAVLPAGLAAGPIVAVAAVARDGGVAAFVATEDGVVFSAQLRSTDNAANPPSARLLSAAVAREPGRVTVTDMALDSSRDWLIVATSRGLRRLSVENGTAVQLGPETSRVEAVDVDGRGGRVYLGGSSATSTSGQTGLGTAAVTTQPMGPSVAVTVDSGSNRTLWLGDGRNEILAVEFDSDVATTISADAFGERATLAASSRSGVVAVDPGAARLSPNEAMGVDEDSLFEITPESSLVASRELGEDFLFGSRGNGVAQLDDIDGDGITDLLIGVPTDPQIESVGLGGCVVALLNTDGSVRASALLGHTSDTLFPIATYTADAASLFGYS